MTDTNIWEQDWFVEMPNEYKLFWCFVKDRCDEVGVWRPNKSIISGIVGKRISLEEFLSLINTQEKTRIAVLPNGRWLVCDFWHFQYGEKLDHANRIHRAYLKRLLSHGGEIKHLCKVKEVNSQNTDSQQVNGIPYPYPIDTLSIPNPYPIDTPQEQEQDSIKRTIGNKYPNNTHIAEFLCVGKINKQVKLWYSKNKNIMQDYLVPKMYKVWKEKFPDYDKEFHVQEVDYCALLNIAYHIAKRKGWMKADLEGVTAARQHECVASWQKIVDYLASLPKTDWFRGLTLDGISVPKNFQRLEMDMKKVLGKKEKTEALEKNRVHHETYFDKQPEIISPFKKK